MLNLQLRPARTKLYHQNFYNNIIAALAIVTQAMTAVLISDPMAMTQCLQAALYLETKPTSRGKIGAQTKVKRITYKEN